MEIVAEIVFGFVNGLILSCWILMFYVLFRMGKIEGSKVSWHDLNDVMDKAMDTTVEMDKITLQTINEAMIQHLAMCHGDKKPENFELPPGSNN